MQSFYFIYPYVLIQVPPNENILDHLRFQDIYLYYVINIETNKKEIIFDREALYGWEIALYFEKNNIMHGDFFTDIKAQFYPNEEQRLKQLSNQELQSLLYYRDYQKNQYETYLVTLEGIHAELDGRIEYHHKFYDWLFNKVDAQINFLLNNK